MTEPQDHRYALRWTHTRQGALLAEPREQGASPIVVGSIEGPEGQMALYIAGLHNAFRHQQEQLPNDASGAADAYMAEQWAGADLNDSVGLVNVRTAYVDGYKVGWQEGINVHREEAQNDQRVILSLRNQVEAAYRRAEAMQESIEQWRGSSDTLKKQRDDETAARAFQEQELKRVIQERDDALVAWRASQKEREREGGELRAKHQELVRVQARLSGLAELAEDYRDLLDDARIVASLSSAPGARQAAAERIRRHSPAVQDHGEEFEQAVTLPNPGSHPDGIRKDEPTDDYDKSTVLHGNGHHSPSYAEGYRDGRNDTAQAFKEPMDNRDQALYAAHLLLAESVAARPETRHPYQRAVRRWQDEYVAVFGTPGEDDDA